MIPCDRERYKNTMNLLFVGVWCFPSLRRQSILTQANMVSEMKALEIA